jgi:uncharacterized membrane protein HdeD (DUF308 family)
MPPLQPSDTHELPSSSPLSMHKQWGIFLAEGIILSLLGLIAIISPLFTGLITTVFLGWLFLVAGIVGLVSTFRARRAPGFGWSLLSALIAVLAGAALLWNPLQGLVTLTFILTAFFILDGLVVIILAIAHRRELSGKWEWMLINGILDLMIAGFILSGLPGTLVWALGLLLGIDLLFAGASLVAMALAARQAAFR